MKRQTFPVRTCKRARRARPTGARGAFTLLEILFALVVTTAVVIAAATSLITTLRAEETSRLLQEAVLAGETVATRFYLGQSLTNAFWIGREAWRAEVAELIQAGSNPVAWQVVTVGPEARLTHRWNLCFGEP